jgi:hypothetical protein
MPVECFISVAPLLGAVPHASARCAHQFRRGLGTCRTRPATFCRHERCRVLEPDGYFLQDHRTWA